MTESFKQLVKDKLSITWDEEVTERRITTLMEDAEEKLNHVLGAEMDYSAPGAERRLFLNYCLYAWNGMEELFKENYKSDIYEIRHKNEVKNYKESEGIQ